MTITKATIAAAGRRVIAPADDLWWVNQIGPKVDVPHVDTAVRQSR